MTAPEIQYNEDGTLRQHSSLGGNLFGEVSSHNVGGEPRRVFFANLNDDGRPDGVVMDTMNSMVHVFVGGDGAFAPLVPIAAVAVPAIPTDAAAGDFNNDGREDLVISLVADNLAILLSDEHGHFAAYTELVPGDTSVAVATGDLDGDGTSDVAVVYADGGGRSLRVYNSEPD